MKAVDEKFAALTMPLMELRQDVKQITQDVTALKTKWTVIGAIFIIIVNLIAVLLAKVI